jgi:hypothetical protein
MSPLLELECGTFLAATIRGLIMKSLEKSKTIPATGC